MIENSSAGVREASYFEVPQDVELCDVNLIIPKKDVFTHMGSYAAFVDVLYLQRFDFKEKIVVGWEHENTLITPTVLGFEQSSHPLAERMLYNAIHPLAVRPYDPFGVKRKR